jgi:hypothetical protein
MCPRTLCGEKERRYRLEDAIGLLILIVIALALLAALIAVAGLLLAFLGMGVLFVLDLLSSSLSWLGGGPVVGWLVLGALVGLFFGLVTGLKATGRTTHLRHIYGGAAALLALLLAAGITSPVGRAVFQPAPTLEKPHT